MVLITSSTVYALISVVYGVATFNDCPLAKEELLKEIKEARDDLKQRKRPLGRSSGVMYVFVIATKRCKSFVKRIMIPTDIVLEAGCQRGSKLSYIDDAEELRERLRRLWGKMHSSITQFFKQIYGEVKHVVSEIPLVNEVVMENLLESLALIRTIVRLSGFHSHSSLSIQPKS
ncbi:unnamed protein product [Angiostrongylus costaricensis]|uniref:Dolichol-phosphate mannosyltransferase subunit 3 n=1 Tax=Angiostrongylus costaricensis TaxID=334426 RepID=A0A158PFK8_ANGCS|nr:unnamed protein product [Angiostrongylus costaricensis]